MPPKMFQIKKTERREDDDDDNVIISDAQLQRLQRQQAEAASLLSAEHRRAQEAEALLSRVKGEATAVSTEAAVAAAARSQPGQGWGRRGGPAEGGAAQGGGRGAPLLATVTAHVTGHAEVLPVDTMDSLLAQEMDPYATGVYQPVPLRPQHTKIQRQQQQHAAPAVLAPNAGTAFLEEAQHERERARATNRQFFTHFEGSRSGGGPAEGVDILGNEEHILLQLPRPVKGLTSSLALQSLPPGRIGKLVVYRSGRTVLRIGNVSCDVAMQGTASDTAAAAAAASATQQDDNPSSSPDPSAPPPFPHPISQFAVAIDDPSSGHGGMGMGGFGGSCYQLCWIPRKAVCTPEVSGDNILPAPPGPPQAPQ